MLIISQKLCNHNGNVKSERREILLKSKYYYIGVEYDFKIQLVIQFISKEKISTLFSLSAYN